MAEQSFFHGATIFPRGSGRVVGGRPPAPPPELASARPQTAAAPQAGEEKKPFKEYLKTCARCQRERPLSDYHRVSARRHRDGRHHICKTCRVVEEVVSRNRRRAQKAGIRGEMDLSRLQALFDAYGPVCLCCGSEDDLTLDHIVPLETAGGPDAPENLQILCRRCNSGKNARAIDFRPDGGARYLRALGLDETLGQTLLARWNRVQDLAGATLLAHQDDLFASEIETSPA
jgi:5-methylcytosine-specific restriction endonuclease McrA